MNKRITSFLICFIMVFSMLTAAISIYAVTYESTTITVTPDKSTANPGDIITYTITLGPVSDMGTLQMQLVIPEGLTYVANSGKLADGLKEKLGFDDVAFTESSLVINGVSVFADYESDTDTEIAIFKCKVNDGFTGTTKLGLTYLEFYSCQTWTDHTSRFTVEDGTVLVEAIPVAVTGVTIDEALSVKTGESKTPSYTVNPTEATNKAVSFKSDNTAVAIVNEATGEVTGVKKGTATITITTADGGFTDTCFVTVSCSHASKTRITEKASDCKDKGWDAYVKCDDCGQLFKTDGITEISEIPFRPLTDDHEGGEATCTAQAICTVCGEPYGDFASHDYTAETKRAEMLKTAGNCRDYAVYYYSCFACGKVENNDEHTFNGDKDAETHVGGTHIEGNLEPDHKNQVAGSTGATICDGCGGTLSPATPIAPDAHIPADVWSNDGESHWKECAVDGCGAVIEGSDGEHTSTGANAATCQKAAVCDVCNASYGTVADHDWNVDNLEKDESGHWHKCNTNGCTATHDFAEHTPDREEGTETDPIKCSVCGYEIAPVLEHTHAYGTDWKSDADNHWNECACGDKANTAPHNDENTDGKCDVCEYNVGIPDDPDNPQTGDGSIMTLWIILICGGILGVTVITVLGKKKSVK